MPATRVMTKAALQTMLNQHRMVYVKPDMGSFGQGVMRVEKITSSKGTQYLYQHGDRPRAFSSFDRLYRAIGGSKIKKNYLVQKGIHLLKFRQRRFDIRVMIQKSPKGAWEATGLIGRLSHPKRIVTNYHSGGTPLPVGTLMQPHLNKARRSQYNQKLRILGVAIAKHMQKSYPGLKEIGVDIAVDRTMKPWILEVNSRPDPFIFNQLKDKSMYRRIYRYAKAYGRLK